MSTAVTLSAAGCDVAAARTFFARIAELEALLSRFRPESQISRLARGELDLDVADVATREVLARCAALRELTAGDFEFEPRARWGDPTLPVLDVNAYAKGWIAQEAATAVSLVAPGYFVNAGGDVIAGRRADGSSWRVGIQHPTESHGLLAVIELRRGAVATSGRYERGPHIHGRDPSSLVSVSVAGPDLGEADALSTAVMASGNRRPVWWDRVADRYGLLTLDGEGWLDWAPPETDETFELVEPPLESTR